MSIRKIFCWCVGSIFAALIAFVIGAVGGDVITAAFSDSSDWLQSKFEEWRSTKSFTIGEDTGVAYPELLFQSAIDEGYQIEFKPKNLEKVAVCEFFRSQGRSWKDLALTYLEKYSNCFIVRKINDKKIEVRPDTRPSSLLFYNEIEDTFWCKCSPDVAPVQ